MKKLGTQVAATILATTCLALYGCRSNGASAPRDAGVPKSSGPDTFPKIRTDCPGLSLGALKGLLTEIDSDGQFEGDFPKEVFHRWTSANRAGQQSRLSAWVGCVVQPSALLILGQNRKTGSFFGTVGEPTNEKNDKGVDTGLMTNGVLAYISGSEKWTRFQLVQQPQLQVLGTSPWNTPDAAASAIMFRFLSTAKAEESQEGPVEVPRSDSVPSPAYVPRPKTNQVVR